MHNTVRTPQATPSRRTRPQAIANFVNHQTQQQQDRATPPAPTLKGCGKGCFRGGRRGHGAQPAGRRPFTCRGAQRATHGRGSFRTAQSSTTCGNVRMISDLARFASSNRQQQRTSGPPAVSMRRLSSSSTSRSQCPSSARRTTYRERNGGRPLGFKEAAAPSHANVNSQQRMPVLRDREGPLQRTRREIAGQPHREDDIERRIFVRQRQSRGFECTQFAFHRRSSTFPAFHLQGAISRPAVSAVSALRRSMTLIKILVPLRPDAEASQAFWNHTHVAPRMAERTHG